MAVDHAKKKVVISIRGTLSPKVSFCFLWCVKCEMTQWGNLFLNFPFFTSSAWVLCFKLSFSTLFKFVWCAPGRLDWSDGGFWTFTCRGTAWNLARPQGETLSPDILVFFVSQTLKVISYVNSRIIVQQEINNADFLSMLLSLSPSSLPLNLFFSFLSQGMVYSAEYIKKKLEQEMILSQAFGRDLVHDSVCWIKNDRVDDEHFL